MDGKIVRMNKILQNSIFRKWKTYAHTASIGSFKFDLKHIKEIPKFEAIEKHKDVFGLIDPDVIIGHMNKLFQKQRDMLRTPNLSATANFDDLRLAYNYIVESIGKEKMKVVVNDLTENWSYFRVNHMSVYVFVVAAALYFRSKILLALSMISYGMYVYSIMFKKYFRSLQVDYYQAAIQQMRNNSIYKIYNGDHYNIVTAIVIGEVNKVLKSKKITPTSFSRMFSYIKHRFNQAIKTLAKYYYDITKRSRQSTDKETISGTEKYIMINRIIESHKNAVSENSAKIIIKNIYERFRIHVPCSYEDFEYFFIRFMNERHKFFIDILKDFYSFLFSNIINSKEEVCNGTLLKKLLRLLVDKRSTNSKYLKETLKSMLEHVNKKQSNKFDFSKSTLLYPFRKTAILILYFYHLKPIVCGH